MEAPKEEVHQIAPANLPLELRVPEQPPDYPKYWSRETKVKIVADFLAANVGTKEFCARFPLVSFAQMRGWIQSYNAEARKLMDAAPPPTPPPDHVKEIKEAVAETLKVIREMKPKEEKKVSEEKKKGGGTYRFISDDQKKMMVVRHLKSGSSIMASAKKFGVAKSSLDRWLVAFRNAKDVKRQLSVRELVDAHAPPQEERRGKDGRRIPPIDPAIGQAVELVASGIKIAEVAERYQTGPSTVRSWWRTIKGNQPWPDQYGRGQQARPAHATTPPRGPRGPYKKTLERGEVTAAAVPEELAITEGLQHKGKRAKDAIMFLRMARTAGKDLMKAGKIEADEPLFLYSMLALRALSD